MPNAQFYTYLIPIFFSIYYTKYRYNLYIKYTFKSKKLSSVELSGVKLFHTLNLYNIVIPEMFK